MQCYVENSITSRTPSIALHIVDSCSWSVFLIIYEYPCAFPLLLAVSLVPPAPPSRG